MPPRAHHIFEDGSSQQGVNLKYSRHQTLDPRATPSKRTAYRGDTQCGVAIRDFSQCHLCPCESFIIPASKEVSMCCPCAHSREGQIHRAQALSMHEMVNGPIGFAEP